MLIASILTTLGGVRCGPLVPHSSSGGGSSKDPNVLSAAEGYQLLVQCEAVKEAPWAFRLYLARWGGGCLCVGVFFGGGFLEWWRGGCLV